MSLIIKTATDLQYKEILDEACAKATYAFKASEPEPMTIVNHQTGQRWTVNEGPCGFSWVIIKDGRSAFVRFLRKNNIGRKHYYGGWEIFSCGTLVPFSGSSQSYTRKADATSAAVEVLQAHGITAYSMSRYD